MNTQSTFTHLRVHSHYTLLGSTVSIPALIERARADGLAHIALTDTNALYGALAFARACRRAAIQPILGMTVHVKLSHLQQEKEVSAAMTGELVLLAQNIEGYRSLCRISSAMQGSPQREQLAQSGIDWEVIKANRTGLLCLCGGRRSWIEQAVRQRAFKDATTLVSRLAGVFDERFYLALTLYPPVSPTQPDAPDASDPSDLPDQTVAQRIFNLGKRFGVQCVAVQPVYSLEAGAQEPLRLLAAIERNCALQEIPATGIDHSLAFSRHWLSAAEMNERFALFPTALNTIGEIVTQCGDALPDGRPIWPTLKLAEGEDANQALTRQATQGWTAKFADQPETRQRLDQELTAIAHHGFAPFFLLVAEIVRFAREQAIPVSTRGSVANSLVAYSLTITTVDPILHDLLFERFLNPARTSLPDIDLDFCSRRRDEVLDYVRRTYGEDRVALVATISTFQPRSALRAVAKAYQLEDATTDRLVKLLPDQWHPDPRRRVHSEAEEIVRNLTVEAERQAVRAAYTLIGQPDHLSIHPGGVVVTPSPLTDYVPLQWTAKGWRITQFDHGDVEAIGLPKLDLLGIRALTVLSDASALVRQHDDPTFDLANIPLDDPETGKSLAGGDTIGVFQCESSGAQRTLRQLKASTIHDLAVANAFFKPGPATGGMATHFIRRYRGEEPVSYLHPALEPILRPTQGVLLFQEQILRVAHTIAGLSWAEAEGIRKGMSKFQPHEMEAISARFIAGCQRPAPDGPGFTPQQAVTLWDQVRAFAGFGFNQGHATAYADVSYRSAWLKTHYPAPFLAARLAEWGGFHHPAVYIAEAIRLGIAVHPPHVNHSGEHFTLEIRRAGDKERGRQGDKETRSDLPLSLSPCLLVSPSALWMGLGQIRDLRQSAIAVILAARRQGLFASLEDLRQRVALQPKELTHLIQSGALDGLGESRAALLVEAKKSLSNKPKQLGFDFFANAPEAESPQTRMVWEEEILGWPVSVHPASLVAKPATYTPLSQVRHKLGQRITTVGARLPGWTGGKGYFLSDGQDYLLALGGERPRPWQAVQVQGKWMVDEWGGGFLQVEQCLLVKNN